MRITEEQVVEAYRAHLRLEVRFMELDGETGICRETPEQAEERMDAMVEADFLRMQYIDQHVK